MVTTVMIAGMRSVHCTRAVFTALGAIDGIASAGVSIGRAVIEHDGRATAAQLREAIHVAGYSVTDVREERRRLV